MVVQTLIDLSKMKTLYSGLGQFSLHFGRYISEKRHLPFFWNFLVPPDYTNIFGNEWNYRNLSLGKRFFPEMYRKYDLWHAIHQDSPYLPSDRKTPAILTIHDLNFLEEKQGFKVRRSLKNLQEKVDRASYITFISEYTAKIASENLNLGCKPCKVIYNGVEIDTRLGMNKPAFLPDGPFLFTIGMVLKKKNFHVLIDFLEHLPEYKLIIAGDKNNAYAHQLENTICQKKLADKILMPGIISEEDKVFLFRNCEAFLFPSLIEGFGLPVIEAMRFGKPVFCSRRSSLPEIGGENAFYWDSYDPAEMKKVFVYGMEYYRLNQPEVSEKNKIHSARFTWEKSIRQYLDVYSEVTGIDQKMNKRQISPEGQAGPVPGSFSGKPDMAIRVLHLSSERSWRGGEQQIAYLIDELGKIGVENFIACRKGSSFETYCREKSWNHYALNFTPPFDIRTAWQIGRICRRNRIHILHMHTSYGHTMGTLSTIFGNEIKMVLSRRVDNPIRNNWFTMWKYNHPSIRKIITVSDAIREIMERKISDRSRLLTIHSGIDTSRFRNIVDKNYFREKYHIDEKTLIIGNTSALSDHKDYPTFLKVAGYLRDKGIMAVFFIIGTGELEENIKSMIDQAHLGDHVIMTGFLRNLGEILPGLDIFLMTSKTEGLGTSILDAFASGVPVVATRAGGIPEMVINEKTGMLSPIGDFQDLGENIIRLARDVELRNELVINAGKMVMENFSRERTAAMTLEVYRKILFNEHES
jgi:L-malate glycosyltransferase